LVSRLKSRPEEMSATTLPMAWLPVFFGLSVICVESTTTMGSANTSRWLLDICHALWGQTDDPAFEAAHHFLRKMGHFCGYGTLSLLFYRAWFTSLLGYWRGSLQSLRFESSGLAVVCTFVIACLDEWHQSMLAGRTSSFYDVLIDVGGAVVFNLVLLVVVRRRRGFLFRAVG
jgi:VanZ family protein